MCVIDSEVAFTGGVNLADEYINRRERFGHWLDCGVMLRGEAVYSFTLMFLSMWDYIRHEEDDASRFLPRPGAFDGIEDDGFVQPYSDAPSDDEAVGDGLHKHALPRRNILDLHALSRHRQRAHERPDERRQIRYRRAHDNPGVRTSGTSTWSRAVTMRRPAGLARGSRVHPRFIHSKTGSATTPSASAAPSTWTTAASSSTTSVPSGCSAPQL
ncbi:MAG: hypothetical protein ACLUEK_11365 [Oscillospiraceae bacterium]